MTYRSTNQRGAEADDEKAHLWLIRVEAEKGRQIKKWMCEV
jgi:hypothetical protein